MYTLFSSLDFFLKFYGFPGYIENSNESTEQNPNSAVGTLLWGLTFLIGFLLNRLRNYLFPVIFIATGKQLREYEIRKMISYFVFGVIFASLFTDFIYSFLTDT